MSKAKGMSAEEKLKTLLAVFRTHAQPFNMEEIEKVGSSNGVRQDTIKDNVKILVDDKLVQSDKIGSGNFYWSFPSDELMRAKRDADTQEAACAREERLIADLEARLTKAQQANKDAVAVAAALAEIEALKSQYESLSKQAQALADCDPAVYLEIKNAAKAAHSGCNRWTENVLSVRAWLHQKMQGRSMAEISKMMGIDEDFDFPGENEADDNKAKKSKGKGKGRVEGEGEDEDMGASYY